MSTKNYSGLRGCLRLIAFIAILCLPFLSVSVNAAASKPTNVVVANVTTTSATLQWEVPAADCHGYDIRVSTNSLSTAALGSTSGYGTASATDPGMVVFVNDTVMTEMSFALTGLTEGTHYYVYFRQNGSCAFDDHSAWVNNLEFSTPCVATAALPVVTDFNEGAYVPSCWSTGGKTPAFVSTTKRGTTGYAARLSADGNAGSFLYSPVFTSNARAYYFKAYVYGAAGAVYHIGIAGAEDLNDVQPVAEGTITANNTWTAIDVVMPLDYQAMVEGVAEYVWVIQNPAANNAKDIYVDDISIEYLPSCVAPANLEATPAENSISLAWLERGTATAWNIAVALNGDTTYHAATTNPFEVTGLNSNTEYSVAVQAACSASDLSEWSGWLKVKTTCGTFSLPFNEDFNSYAGLGSASTRPNAAEMPDCWNWEGDSKLFCMVGNSSSYAANGRSLFFSGYSTATVQFAYAYLPAIDAENAAVVMTLKAKYENTTSGGDLVVGYVTTPGDASTFQAVTTLPRTTSMRESEIFFPAMQTLYPVIRYEKPATSYYYAGVDDIRIEKAPTCLKPTNLHTADITATSVKLAWTPGTDETKWLLTYKLSQNAPIDTVEVQGTPEYTISGLTSKTKYTLSALTLQAICSAEDSSAVATFSAIPVTTLCEAVVSYEDDFETSNSGSGNLPDCWAKAYSSSSSYPYVYDYAYYAHSGSKSLYTYAYSSTLLNAVLALPEVSGDIQNYRLKLWAKSTSAASNLIVGVMTNPADTATFVALDTLATTSAYALYNVQFAGYVGDGKFAALKYYNLPTSLYIDDVVLELVPSCEKPEALAAEALSDTTVKVTVEDFVDAHTAWEVVVGEKGFNPDEATPIAISAKSATITIPFSMVGDSLYDAYVRTVCNANDKSEWRKATTFKYTDWSPLCAGLAFATSAPYMWTLAEEDEGWTATSGNAGIANSQSYLTAYVTVPDNAKVTVSFDYEVDGETNYDYLMVFLDDACDTPDPTKETGNYDKGFGYLANSNTTVSGSYSYVFTAPGEHRIMWCFRKDGSGNKNRDCAKIYNVTAATRSCVEPTDFTMGAITDSTAVLNWNNTGADQWVVALFAAEQSSSINVANALHVDTVAENTVAFAQLTANTAYFAYVRSLCGENPSDWSAAATFRTECASKTLPYAESFEDAAALLCWKAIGEPVAISQTTTAFDLQKAASIKTDSVTVLLVSPRFDVASLAAYDLNLAVYALADTILSVGVIVDPSDIATYIDLGSINLTTARVWNEYRLSLAALATEDYEDYADAKYVAISIPANQTVYFDALSISMPASCLKPTALAVTPVGEAVSIDWESEAEAHYMEVALPVGSRDSLIFAGNVTKPCSIDTLEGNTLYKVRVRAICEADSSEWTPWLSFTTPCALSTLPFSQNFDAFTSAPTASYTVAASARIAPDCWKVIADGTSVGSIMKNSSYASSGSNAMMFYGMETVHIVLPTFNANNKALRFRMTYRTEGTYTSSGHLAVGYLTNPSSAASFVGLDTLPQTTTKTPVEYIFPAMQYVTPCVLYIGGTASNWYAAFDDVMVDFAPTCLKPTHLALDTITTNSAKLTWTPGDSETAWQLIYKLSTKAAPDTVAVTGTPEYTISGLTPATNYTLSNIALRAICSESDSSEVYTPAALTFSTECGVLSLPYEETFDNNPVSSCWILPTGVTMTNNASYAASGRGVLQFATIDTVVAVLPEFGSLNGKRFIYKWRCEGAGTTTTMGYLKAGYITDPTDAATFVTLSDFPEHEFTYQLDTIVFANVPENARPAFLYYGATAANWYLFVDDILIEEPAACDRPTTVTFTNIEGTSVVALIDDADGSAWEYVLNDQAATPVAVATDSFLISDLAPQTNYTIYVRRVCSATDKSAWRSATFKTGCGVYALPFSENFETPEGASAPLSKDCWILPTGVTMATVYNASYATSGSGVLKFATSSQVVAILPNFGDLNGKLVELSWRCEGTGTNTSMGYIKVGYITDTEDNSTFVALADYHQHNYAYTTVSVPFNNVPANARVAIQYYGATGSGWYLFVDDVVVANQPACMKPSQLFFLEATSTTIKMEIEDVAGATWEYAVDTVSPVAVSDTIFTIADLTPDTDYTIYLRRVCSASEKSEWITREAFTTHAPVEAMYEDVEGATVLSGWYVLSSTSTSYPSVSSTEGNNSANALYFSAYSSSPYSGIFAMPEVTGNLTGYRFMVDAKKSTATAAGDLILGVSNALGGEITYVDTITPNTATYTTYTMDFSSYTGTGKFPILYVKNMQTNLYLDNFAVEPIPSCERPQAVDASGATATSVNVTITDTVSAHTAWEAVVVEHDANPATGTPVALNSKAAVVNGTFVGGVTYDVYVRAVCGEGEYSSWRGPATFKFVDYTVVTSLPVSAVGNYPWTVNGNRLESTNQGVSSSASEVELTVEVPTGLLGALSFNYWVESEGGYSMYDYLCVYVDEPNPTTSNYHSGFDKKGGSPAVTGTYTINLTGGTHKIRWRYYKDSSTNTGEDKAQIWNIALNVSAFYVPSDLHLTALSDSEATIAWSGCTDATGYQVRFRRTGLDTIVDVTSTEATFEGLLPNTSYTTNVRACNATDTTAWSSAFKFVTPCATDNLPYVENFDAYSNVPTQSYSPTTTKLPNCWTILGTGSKVTVMTASSYAASGANVLMFMGSSDLVATLPTFHADSMAVSFKVKYKTESATAAGNGTFLFGYLVVPGDASSFVSLAAGPLNSSISTVSMTIPAAATVTPAIKYVAGTADNWYAAIDDIELELITPCSRPEAVEIINAAATQVDVLISDANAEHNAWEVAFGKAGFNPEGAEAQIDTTQVKVLSIIPAEALVADSIYEVYARTLCDGDMSPWVKTSFKYVDYSIVAQGLGIQSNGTYPWAVVMDGATHKLESTNEGHASSVSDMKTSFVVAEGEIGKLSFNWKANGSSSYGYLVMFVDTVPAAAYSSAYYSDFGQKYGTSEYENYAYTYSPVEGSYSMEFMPGAHSVIWRYYISSNPTSTSYTYDFVDGRKGQVWDLTYSAISSWAPRDLTLRSVGTDSALIAWTQCNNVVKNQIMLGETVLEATADSIVLHGLSPNTEYSVQVRSILASDTTAWSDPLSFRTECVAFALPFAEDFNELTEGIPSCWDNAEGTTTTETYKWNYYESGQTGAGLRFNSYTNSTGNTNTLKTPEINVAQADKVVLTFAYKNPAGGKMDVIATLDGRDTTIQAFRAGSSSTTTWKTYQYNIPVAGVESMFIKYAATSNYGNGDAYLYLDDIRISRIAEADTIREFYCSGEDYEGHGFSMTAAQLHVGENIFTRTEVATSEMQADSIYTLVLTIGGASPVTAYRDTACANEAYTGYGFDLPANLVTTTRTTPFVRHELNQFGCDSTISLTLFVPEPYLLATDTTISEGESILFGDSLIYTAGTYTRIYQNQYGCDSTIILNVDVITAIENVEVLAADGDRLVIAPNPINAGEEAEIVTMIIPASDYTLRVFDAVGKLVEETTKPTGKVPALSASGAYTVIISNDGKQYQAKLLVK